MGVVFRIYCKDLDDLTDCLKRLEKLRDHFPSKPAVRVENVLMYPDIVVDTVVERLADLHYLLEMMLTEFGAHKLSLEMPGPLRLEYVPAEEEG